MSPSPSWYAPFLPHTHRPPSLLTAPTWSWPEPTKAQSLALPTATGAARNSLSFWPIWP